MIPLWLPEVDARVRREAFALDPQAVPTEVRFCRRCVISNQRPRIVFDQDGVCSACRFAERKRAGIDWPAREKALQNLLRRHRRKDGYDVVVPCSGGKDSAMIAHRLRHEYGMHPLCVTWAPFLYTDTGRWNFEAFVQSGFDVIVGHPAGLIHRKLARLALEYVGDPFLPFIYGQLAFPMRMAARFGIRLVFYGENGEAEYGGDPAANDKPCWDTADWERVYLKGSGVDRLVARGRELGAITGAEARAVSEFYRVPSREEMAGTEFHWFSYYRPWHPQANFYYAAEHTGFEPNPERSEGTYSKYASLDDKLDGLHYWLGYVKFGIGRATSDAAHEIRDGEITREEGVALVRRFDGEFPGRDIGDCLAYLGLDLMHLLAVADRFRAEHIWEYTPGTGAATSYYRLRHAVWHEDVAAAA